VDDNVLRRYFAHLQVTLCARDPARTITVLARAWNKHVFGQTDYPCSRLNAPHRSRKYALDWDDLAASLRDDVNDFHQASLHPDPLDLNARQPISPNTVKNRDFLIRRLAAALVARGIHRDDLKNLADLFRLDRLKEGLRFFLERKNGQPCTQVPHIINLALVIGTRWINLPGKDVEELVGLARKFRSTQNGLTAKNRTRLRQFADDMVISTLLNLPARMFAAANKMPLSPRSARKAQMALAIELLIFAPMRIGNLITLDRHQHFHWARHNGQPVLHIVIPETDVKNRIGLEFPLSAEVTAMLDAYMEKYQPILARSTWPGLLFPGEGDGPKQQAGFSRAISAALLHEAGLKMNPHLFRHLAALIFLERHPGCYEEVRRLLGHKRIETTIRNYAGLEMTAAVRRYDEAVLSRRDIPSIPKRRRDAA
jgi:integrase